MREKRKYEGEERICIQEYEDEKRHSMRCHRYVEDISAIVCDKEREHRRDNGVVDHGSRRMVW